MTWFERLTGIQESSPQSTRNLLSVEGEWMVSRANGRRMRHGRLELASPSDLRARVEQVAGTGRLVVSEVVSDAAALHHLPENRGALFQAASQFNLLEMASPELTPEAGIGIYERDRTQGPACAIACGAGTIFRNYLVEIGGETGQSADRQIDCLSGLADLIGQYWSMQNGYAFASRDQLHLIRAKIESATEDARREMCDRIRVGIQWNTEVTAAGPDQIVSQVYCSALPVGYSSLLPSEWEAFGRLVLDAAYEATFAAAVLNAQATGNPRLFLTFVGGGVFRNNPEWIEDAIVRAAYMFREYALDCRIVSYRRPSEIAAAVIRRSQQF